MFKNKTTLIVLFLVLPSIARADFVGEKRDFFIDSSFDAMERTSLSASLREKSNYLYFYIDDDWWRKFGLLRQAEIKSSLSFLSQNFAQEIYPVLTSTFGSEWKPGIDGDERITVLLHPLKEGAKGYYRTTDEYSRIQALTSNVREMVYLNANYITEGLAKSYLAHEFQHLISFNQKERKYGTPEEVWLQEAISEYVPTLVGYDETLEGSNLEIRLKTFLKKPSDSLTEWQGATDDYGALNIFTQYLVEHYGVEILVQALQSSKTGIAGLNEALLKNGFEKDFSQIFQDWAIAVLVNDCSLGKEYCYTNESLANLKITPSLNFLPFVSKTSLKIEDSIKDWSGQWYKLVGGKGNLTLRFDGIDEVKFYVGYWACKNSKDCDLASLELNERQEGSLTLSHFGSDYSFLTLILSTQEKTTDFRKSEPAHPFTFEVLMNEEEEPASAEATAGKEEEELIQQLLDKIAFLKAEIAKVQAKIDALLAKRTEKISCQSFDRNLYYGMRNNPDVRCLQEFLKSQGLEIYPEGLVTGNFLGLTKTAVIRLQEKYAEEILHPLGLEMGTGFFGPATRTKINQLLVTW